MRTTARMMTAIATNARSWVAVVYRGAGAVLRFCACACRCHRRPQGCFELVLCAGLFQEGRAICLYGWGLAGRLEPVCLSSAKKRCPPTIWIASSVIALYIVHHVSYATFFLKDKTLTSKVWCRVCMEAWVLHIPFTNPLPFSRCVDKVFTQRATLFKRLFATYGG